MTVQPVGAFRSSDGTCHQSKQDAYNAEVKFLYDTLPRTKNVSITEKTFNKLASEVEQWLKKAKALSEQMVNEPDPEVARSIKGQV